jgi:iron complex transport system substrate-binding protein
MLLIKRLYPVLLILLLLSCRNNPVIKKAFDTEARYTVIKHATKFRIQQKDGYKVLTVLNPWQGAENITQTYYLAERGKTVADLKDSDNIIRVPIRSIICMSTTHLSMITALSEIETIKGVSGSEYVYDSAIKGRLQTREIYDVGYEDNLNKELIVQISPDLIMAYGVGSESANYVRKLKELGVKVIFNADYLETDPLGKAEWIKVFGALYNKEKLSDSIFSSISDEYESISGLVKDKAAKRPTVFLGLPFKDTWFISPGNSYISQLISDAGGEYIWKDNKSDVSMPYGIENVFIKALHADFWLNSGSAGSKAEIASIDNRLKELPSFRNGNIFNNNNRVTNEGGNDYWESGSLRPQVILMDIATVLHPELFPGYELYYYKRIE